MGGLERVFEIFHLWKFLSPMGFLGLKWPSTLVLSDFVSKWKIYHAAHSSFEIYSVFRPQWKKKFGTFFKIFFCKFSLCISVCTTYPSCMKIKQKLSIPQLNARFMQKISKTGQNQKNAYISDLSSPCPKPFGVINPLGW